MKSKSLERCLEITKTGINLMFHPTGIRGLAQDIGKRLKLSPINSQIVSGIGLSGDILKYSHWYLTAGLIGYYYLTS